MWNPRRVAARLGVTVLLSAGVAVFGSAQDGEVRNSGDLLHRLVPGAMAAPAYDNETVEGSVLKKRCYCGTGQLIIGTLDGATLVRIMPLSQKDQRRRNDDYHKKRGGEDRLEQDDFYANCDEISVGDYVYVNEGVRQTETLWDGYRISYAEGNRRGSTQKASDSKDDDGEEEDRLEEPEVGPPVEYPFADAALMIDPGKAGTLVAGDGKIRVEVSADLFSRQTILVIRPVTDGIATPPDAASTGVLFELATESCDQQPAAFTELPGAVTLSATPGGSGGRPEIVRWDAKAKSWQTLTTTASADQRQVSVSADRLGIYAAYLKRS